MLTIIWIVIAIYTYNAVGEITAYAKGLSQTDCTLEKNNAKVELEYDELGNLLRETLDIDVSEYRHIIQAHWV